MRHARLLPLVLLTLLLAACTTSSPGWTYVPAPSATPAPSAAGSATPSGSTDPNVVRISAFGVKFEQAEVTAPAGVSFQIVFENKDPGTPHNVALYLGSPTGAELFKSQPFNGVETRTYTIPPLDAGTYAFVCTVHPTMVGTLTVK